MAKNCVAGAFRSRSGRVLLKTGGDLVLGSEDAGDYSEEECTRFSAIVVKEAFW